MKERPILFSGAMTRAILAGQKTQTRRVVKPQPHIDAMGNFCWDGWNFGQDFNGPHIQAIASPIPSSKTGRVHCPHGKPGDRLWVRETWSTHACFDHLPPSECPKSIHYWADGKVKTGKGRPSIHMPRWASRILLEIVSVRVERLQDISEADAEAEGCERLDSERDERDWKICPQCGGTGLYTALGAGGGVLPDTDCRECDTYAKRYRHLWDSINGEGSWAANPWVWVIEFKRVETHQLPI